jgi:hypothetical protein
VRWVRTIQLISVPLQLTLVLLYFDPLSAIPFPFTWDWHRGELHCHHLEGEKRRGGGGGEGVM